MKLAHKNPQFMHKFLAFTWSLEAATSAMCCHNRLRTIKPGHLSLTFCNDHEKRSKILALLQYLTVQWYILLTWRFVGQNKHAKWLFDFYTSCTSVHIYAVKKRKMETHKEPIVSTTSATKTSWGIRQLHTHMAGCLGIPLTCSHATAVDLMSSMAHCYPF